MTFRPWAILIAIVTAVSTVLLITRSTTSLYNANVEALASSEEYHLQDCVFSYPMMGVFTEWCLVCSMGTNNYMIYDCSYDWATPSMSYGKCVDIKY